MARMEASSAPSPMHGNGRDSPHNYPHTPNSTGGGMSVFNDNMTIDSWGTAMTQMLQPHKSQKGSFQCPTHLAFITKDPLEACPHCERQQRLSLQERRQSVEQQLKDIDGVVGEGGSGSNQAAKDILSELQSTVNQWKQSPATADTSHPAPPARSSSGSGGRGTPQQQAHHLNSENEAHNHSSMNGMGHNVPSNSGNTSATAPAHGGAQAVTPNHMGPNIQSPPALNGVAGMVSPPPHSMMMPSPPMVPTFGSHNTHNTTSSSPLEALAAQIQGMQRMQDWMLYQKEQECQTLRQRLDAATQQINTLAVENALLQEKLNQQEQRMKHELKLIKLAAMQQRNNNNNNNNSNRMNSHHNGSQNFSSSEMVVASSAGQATTSSRVGGGSVSSHHSTGSAGQASHGGGSDFLFPSDALASATTATSSVQPKTAVVPSALSHHDANLFHSNDQFVQNNANDISTMPTSSRGFQEGPKSSFTSKQMSDHSSTFSRQSQQQQQNKSESDFTGPVDLDEVTDMINANPEEDDESPVAPIPAQELPRENVDRLHIPRDIQVDQPVDTGSTGSGNSKSIPTLPPPPDKAVRSAGSSSGKKQHWPDQETPISNVEKTPAPVVVNFPDSDNMSIGNTVASSTYGEDRQQVVQQVILDPYGDKGTYTGVILRSTGMPHGSGRMIYQEDKRTYDGEWRHGRWHGYGRATFANGDNYHGEYRFDQRHGHGRYEWNDGRVYDGMFREDKRHGRGIFTWPDGAVYDGDFRNGQREGHGTYRFSDGGRYEGSWKDGRYNGFGICNWEDGRCYKGEWLNGMAHGKGVETFADGSVRHDGQWIEDEPISS